MFSKLVNFYGQKRTQRLIFLLLIIGVLYLAFVYFHDGSDKLTLYKVIYGIVLFVELAYWAFGKKPTTSSKSSNLKTAFKVLVVLIGVIAIILAVLTAIFAHGWKFV